MASSAPLLVSRQERVVGVPGFPTVNLWRCYITLLSLSFSFSNRRIWRPQSREPENKREGLYFALSFLSSMCKKPRWHGALFCHQFQLNANESGVCFFFVFFSFLLHVWFKLLSTPGSRWWRIAGMPQWVLLWEINYPAKCSQAPGQAAQAPKNCTFPQQSDLGFWWWNWRPDTCTFGV